MVENGMARLSYSPGRNGYTMHSAISRMITMMRTRCVIIMSPLIVGGYVRSLRNISSAPEHIRIIRMIADDQIRGSRDQLDQRKGLEPLSCPSGRHTVVP